MQVFAKPLRFLRQIDKAIFDGAATRVHSHNFILPWGRFISLDAGNPLINQVLNQLCTRSLVLNDFDSGIPTRPVSGGMGSHLILKLADGKTIEVHLATTQFVKTYELVFEKGDQVEVTGSKVKLEGVDTIFAREIKSGNQTVLFRDKDGKPAW